MLKVLNGNKKKEINSRFKIICYSIKKLFIETHHQRIQSKVKFVDKYFESNFNTYNNKRV